MARKKAKPKSEAQEITSREAPPVPKLTSRKPLPAVHPWRVCPYGEHWVKTHPLDVPPNKKNPEGSITTRHGHCARNPSGKDQLYPEEIREIAAQNFSDLKNMPCQLELKWPGKAGQYDKLIAGWTQYWNEVLKPDEPLDRAGSCKSQIRPERF